MVDEFQVEHLALLLEATGRAHHQAYIETDGFDPEWPIWYADDLQENLAVALGREITKSEIIYSLVFLSKEQPVAAPDAWWPDFYARYFLEHYD